MLVTAVQSLHKSERTLTPFEKYSLYFYLCDAMWPWKVGQCHRNGHKHDDDADLCSAS